MLRDFRRRQSELAIDLGSTSTRVGVPGRGIVLDLPSVVAVDTRNPSARIVAIGEEAREMLGRTPEHIQASRPVQGNRFEDYSLVQELLDHAVRTVFHGRVPARLRLAIAVGHGTEDVARRALQDSARAIGAREVILIPKGVAAAVGSNLPIDDAVGSLLVDVGGGSTEVVLMSLGGLIDNEVVNVGGQDVDQAIKARITDNHGVSIGTRASETIKLRLARAPHGTDPGVVVTGRDNRTGIPREVRLEAGALTAAVLPALESIVTGLQGILARSTAELSADVADNGIVLSGGGALFPGLIAMLRDTTGLPVVLCENPRHATIQGTIRLLQDSEALARLAWR
jgi:rod shape-determining protein MreB